MSTYGQEVINSIMFLFLIGILIFAILIGGIFFIPNKTTTVTEHNQIICQVIDGQVRCATIRK